jgi:hypothetical protein
MIIMKLPSRKRVGLKWVDMASDRSTCHAIMKKEMNLFFIVPTHALHYTLKH